MQKILITGGAGFIGSHLVAQYLESGYEVAVLDDFSSGRRGFLPDGVTIFEGKIEDADFVEQSIRTFKPNIVSHHAAHISVRASLADPIHDATKNILGSINVFQSAGKNQVQQVVFASSGGAIVPKDNQEFPTPEIEHPTNLGSPYAISKLTAETYLNYFAQQYSFTPTILRYANVYGPHQTPKSEAGVIAIFSEMLTQNQTPTIFGDGNQTRDFVFVGDVAKAHLEATNHKLNGSFNVSTGEETSINTMYEQMAAALGQNTTKQYGPTPEGDISRSALCSKYLQSKSDWKPSTRIHDGITQTIVWAQTFYA